MNVNNHNPLPNGANQVGQPGRINFNNFNNRYQSTGAILIPGPPQTVSGQYINTILAIGSVKWICINGYWGHPAFAYGCLGIIGGILNELRKKFLMV